MSSILQAKAGVQVENLSVQSFDYNRGTTVKATVIVGENRYALTLHHKNKLEDKEAEALFLKNLDPMVILCERYLLSGTKSITFTPNKNTLTRTFEDLTKHKSKKKGKDKSVGIEDFGTSLENKLRKEKLKIFASKSKPVVYKEEEETSSPSDKESALKREIRLRGEERARRLKAEPSEGELELLERRKENRQKTKDRIAHIERALALYNIWKGEGGTIPREAIEGDALIEREDRAENEQEIRERVFEGKEEIDFWKRMRELCVPPSKKGKEKEVEGKSVEEVKTGSKGLDKFAKKNYPDLLSYRAHALLDKGKKKVGWCLPTAINRKDPHFKEKLEFFLEKMACLDEEDLFSKIVLHGLSKPRDGLKKDFPTTHDLLLAIRHCYQDLTTEKLSDVEEAEKLYSLLSSIEVNL